VNTSIELSELRDAVDTLSLVTTALWEVLKENTGLTDAQIREKVTEVDLRDGRQDGKLSPRHCDCRACGRTNGRRRKRCLYCGDALPPATRPE